MSERVWCPYPGCDFNGTEDEVDEHRAENHRDEAQQGSNLKHRRVAVHMTVTEYHRGYDEWLAYCRCGWTGSYLSTQGAAREDGDRHLAEANKEE